MKWDCGHFDRGGSSSDSDEEQGSVESNETHGLRPQEIAVAEVRDEHMAGLVRNRERNTAGE